MHRRHTLIALSLLTLCAIVRAEDYPALVPPADTSSYGQHIQRTMSLLAGSTPEHHNTVRILFYGQSITAPPWYKQVEADLKKRFPNADLTVENRAISGFASPYLFRTTL